jgi:hypothetical protein
MSEEENDAPLRHVILYAKGHYMVDRFSRDLLKIVSKIDPRAKNTAHIIMKTWELVWGAICEFKEGPDKPGGKDHGPEWAYREQWLLLASLRSKFQVSWLRYSEFHKLTDDERAKLEEIFQEEFDNRILEAFLSPLIGWEATFDIGDASGKMLPVMNPKKTKE